MDNEWILLLLQKGFLEPINYNKDIGDKVYCACLSIHSTFQNSLFFLIESVLLITLMTEVFKTGFKIIPVNLPAYLGDDLLLVFLHPF